MKTLARKAKTSLWLQAAELLDPTPDPFWLDPVSWVKTMIPSWYGSSYQHEILTNLAQRRRACVRGPHGLGKSALAAIAVLWFADTRDRAGMDWKVVTTAGAWRQLSNYLWPEIRKWAGRMQGREFTRFELLTLELKLRFGQAFAVASDEPANIEGAHADHILYIIDEGKNVVPGTWDAIEGAMATGEAFALAISTPGRPQGRFFDIQARKPGFEDWWVKHVSLEEAIAAGRISPKWAEQRRTQWGEFSSVYQNRVLGEFSTRDQEGIIPLEWVEAANLRWEEIREKTGFSKARLTCVSCDVSSTGPDETIVAVRSGDIVTRLAKLSKSSTMSTTGVVAGILNSEEGRRGEPPYAIVDVIGVGTGVVDRLRELGFAVDAFNGSEGTKKKDRTGELEFINRRAFAWWSFRDRLDPTFASEVALPTNDELLGDLVAPKWVTTSTGKIKLEEKDEIRRRLGRSPDFGDAVVMAFAGDAPSLLTTDFVPFSMEKSSTWRSSTVAE